MEELDLFKKAWQKGTQSFQQVSEAEIYKMIHKKSSSIVKWILIISIIEFLFWNVIGFAFLGEGYIRKKYGAEIFDYVVEINTIYNFVSYIVAALFIYLFYKNYQSISTTASTKELMNTILKTRKTVLYYVWINILFFVIGTLVILYVQLNFDSHFLKLLDNIKNDDTNRLLIKSILFVVTSLLVTVFFIWLFYKIIYGILLRKLNRNYKELKKLESENN